MLSNNVSPKIESGQLLCANLYVAVDEESHDIRLTLIDCGSGRSEVVYCRNVFTYRIVRDPYNDEPPYFIGSIRVEREDFRQVLVDAGWELANDARPNTAWVIEMHGDVDIHIVCLDFAPQSPDFLSHFIDSA